ncbi:replication protein, partial [Candidatus Pacearchaeota archaeon]|nr:replication protein [Candidatus Pacearchaeota archaeon]
MGGLNLPDGYIAIVTDLWEALCRYRIPGEQRQVLDVIIRKTYGWDKKRDGIPLSQFEQMTGIKRPNIVRAIKALEDKKIIRVIKKDNKYWNEYEINKYFKTWKPLSKKITLSKKI